MKENTSIEQKLSREDGVVIVEATIVFPIIFFVLFFIIFYGSALYVKAKVDYVSQMAVLGSQCVKDPYLYENYKNGTIPTEYKNAEPYRYFIGGMKNVETKIGQDVVNYINDTSSTFFVNMAPKLSTNSEIAKFHNFIIYSTFSVQVNYTVEFPIKFLGESTPTIINFTSRAEVSVNDTPEFIRNVDMVEDMFSGTGMGQKIKSSFEKINKFINKFSLEGGN